MTTAGGIGLFVIGAIITFGLDVEIAGVNLDIIGMILMGAGVIGLALALYRNRTRVRTTVTEQRREPGIDQQIRKEEQ